MEKFRMFSQVRQKWASLYPVLDKKIKKKTKTNPHLSLRLFNPKKVFIDVIYTEK